MSTGTFATASKIQLSNYSILGTNSNGNIVVNMGLYAKDLDVLKQSTTIAQVGKLIIPV